MQKQVLIGTLIYVFSCVWLNAQADIIDDYIVYNKLSPLHDNESFIFEQLIIESEPSYHYIVSSTDGIAINEVLEFKLLHRLDMLKDNKRFLVFLDYRLTYGNKNDYGDPVYYIDGEKGIIEYVEIFMHGWKILEDAQIILDHLYQPGVIGDIGLSIYNIKDKTKHDIDMRNIWKEKTGGEDSFYVEFGLGPNSEIDTINEYIKIYFDQWGENGPKSFYAYLNVKDVNHIFIEDELPPFDSVSNRTSDTLRLRESPDTDSKIVTTLVKGVEVQLLETGQETTIDGITAPWVRVLSSTGYEGWCFSGYLEPIAAPPSPSPEPPAIEPYTADPPPLVESTAHTFPWIWIAAGSAVMLTAGAVIVIIVKKKKH